MKISSKTSISSRALAIAFFILVLGCDGWAAEPTLARLAFRAPADRMAEFEAMYREKIVPILKRHDWTSSSLSARATPDSVFSRLYEFQTLAKMADRVKLFQEDPAFKAALQDLGVSFGPDKKVGLIAHHIGLYRTPAGSGKKVPAGHGKKVTAGRGRGHWRHYDRSDGITTGSSLSILQDREGYLWVGGLEGVNRYDGQTWTAFTTTDGLASDNVWFVFQDREGRMWFGTENGLSLYDGQAFTTFTTRDGLGQNWVRGIFQDREGNLWFGHGGGVTRYDGQTWTPFMEATGLPQEKGLNFNPVWRMCQAKNGDLWFSSWGNGVIRYDGQTWTRFTTKDGLASNLASSIVETPEGHFLVGNWDFNSTSGQALSRYNGTSWSPVEEEIPHSRIGVITRDQNGSLWFGGTNGQVSRHNGQAFTSYTEEAGLSRTFVMSIIQDKEEQMWFGTGTGTVSQYNGQTWTTFTEEDGLAHNDVKSIFQDRKGFLWFSTKDGLSRYDGQTFTNFTTEDGLAHNDVSLVFQDREENLWFGTQGGGICRYNGKIFTTFTVEDGLISNDVLSICQDGKGNLWFGTQGSGVCRYDGKIFTTFNTEDGLGSNRVDAMLQDLKGDLWFATWGGISRYNGQTFANVTHQEQWIFNWVTSALQDRDGHLWFGTLGGVSRYDDGTWTTLTREEGLVSNRAIALLQDQKGHFWFSTGSGGVSRYDGQTFQTLTRQDGLARNEVSAMYEDRDGNVWFATSKGVTRYRPPLPVPAPVSIHTVTANHRYDDVAELNIPSPVGLIAFEFGAISFKTRPKAMVYRYRLKGHEDEWQTTHERRVEYENLPRGRYSFEVEAVDRDLVYSEQPATVALTVHLPYERIGWISALSIAVVLMGWQTVGIIHRDRGLQAANKKLDESNHALLDANKEIQLQTERKSAFLASMSHELRTPITAMKGYVDNILDGIGGKANERHERYLTRVTDNAAHLLDLVNNLLDLSKIAAGRMDVDIASFSVKHLIASCCNTVEPLVQSGVKLVQEVADEADEAHTDEAKLQHAVGNLLSNAVKFTEAGEIAVRAKTIHDQLAISVSDTGIGMPQEALDTIFDEFQQVEGSEQKQKGTGLGLAISKQYTELLGGTILVTSEVGKGTTFTIQLPVNYKEA